MSILARVSQWSTAQALALMGSSSQQPQETEQQGAAHGKTQQNTHKGPHPAGSCRVVGLARSGLCGSQTSKQVPHVTLPCVKDLTAKAKGQHNKL
jgi:hypothetical protein